MQTIAGLIKMTDIGDYNVLILELLGPSLGRMQKVCGNTFSITTTTQLLTQLISIMEYVHDCHIVYRDVKPDNFLLGLPDTSRWCTVILIGKSYRKV